MTFVTQRMDSKRGMQSVRAGIRLVMGVLAVLAMCSAVVKADRKPFELEDLVEQSDLVVVGEVVGEKRVTKFRDN